MSKRCCVECHCAFIPRRNPHQRFCNQRTCQNARKRQWRKQKRSKDPDFIVRISEALKTNGKQNPPSIGVTIEKKILSISTLIAKNRKLEICGVLMLSIKATRRILQRATR